MKHLSVFVILLCCKLGFSQSVIPNGSFDQLQTAFKFTSWESTNGLITLGNAQTIFQSTDSHSGPYACEIITAFMQNRPTPAVPINAGNIFCGRQIQYDSYFRFPYKERPKRFEFWYKFNARNNDSADILVGTTRWNTQLNRRDTLSIKFLYLTDSVGVYTKVVVDLEIRDSLTTPDSAMVMISAAGRNTPFTGTRLLIDDVAFIGGTVGLQSMEQEPLPLLFPNPSALGSVYIDCPSYLKDASINLFGLNGSLILDQKLEPNTLNSINTEQLLPGVYVYCIGDGVQKFFRKLIIQ